MPKPNHGPDCVACQDPANLPGLLAAERAQLDEDAARARKHREAGEAAREEHYRASSGAPEFAETQARMIRELGTANAIASNVRMHRAHLARVEAAHA